MKKILFVFLLIVITAVSAFSQANLQPAATVNLIRTISINVAQLRSDVERMEQAVGRRLSQEERLQVLDVMINERLVMQAAERDRVISTMYDYINLNRNNQFENEVNQEIQRLRGAMAQEIGRQPNEQEFHQAIRAQSGLEFSLFKEQLRRQYISQKYLEQRKGDVIRNVQQTTEAEILAEYNLRRTELFQPKTIRFSMIQVPYGNDAASRTRARTLIDSIHREIGGNPSKFDEVVARSFLPNSGFQAGDAGYLPRNAEARNVVGQSFMDVAFSLNQAQVSRVIEGIQGFQIIKVTESYEEKQLGLTDPVQPGARVTVREYIGQFLMVQKQQTILLQVTQELVEELRGPANRRTFTIFENNLNW